ncbi:MAG: ATP-binding protein [candidate division KSB1 bacterium]|nr:ATP-binding protein [candidate division KSB1 bacterium]
MVQKKIVIILLFIVLLPLIFYTAYEFTSLNENERLIEEIYEQQMNILLYSVNQHAWDVSSRWIWHVSQILSTTGQPLEKSTQQFLTDNAFIESLVAMDTSLTDLNVFPQSTPDTRSMITRIKKDRSIISKLVRRRAQGYAKIEAYRFDETGKRLMFLFVSETADNEPVIVALLVSTEAFISDVLIPKINEIAREEFVIAVFDPLDDHTLFATEPVTMNEINIKRNIWLLPDHLLGISLRGISVKDLANSRFYRSLMLILILDMILLLGAWVVYRNIKKEMELARMKSDFVSNVSHELRTPLSLIRMYAETLELNRVETEAQKHQYYKIIGQETERLTHLLNNILDFSRMEADAKKYHFEKVDLNKIVAHNLNIYREHLEEDGFTFECNLAEKRLEIFADSDAISEVFINLLDNAAKYSEDEKHITVTTGSDDNVHYLEVADRGMGIPQSEHKKVFEKFYRVSSGLTHNTKGSGLGLALARYIMDAHSGRIELTSEPGTGSRFRLVFPLKEIT